MVKEDRQRGRVVCEGVCGEIGGEEGGKPSFGEEHFGAAQLGDLRRTRRLVQLANEMVKHPRGSLPEKLNDPASLKALYRLMGREEVTHESVLCSSRERTLRLAGQVQGTVLHIHDTTELDYTTRRSLKKLGQIGNGSRRGYLLHNTLSVVAETREVLGLAGQQLICRPRAPKGETKWQSRRRENRESRMWKRASQMLPAAPAGVLWVEVADRGADVLEYLDYLHSAQKHYVVRSQHNRRIQLADGRQDKLHDYARRLPLQGSKKVQIPAREGRAAREAELGIGWAKVTLLIPRQPRGEVRGQPLETWVVYVRELNPPPDEQPLEWILLTNVPVENLADAQQRVEWYECRWIIEDYHKALKTGIDIQSLQFTDEQRLQPAIALLSVVALFLLKLREAGRREDAQQRPAREVVPPIFVTVLSLWRYKEVREEMTVYEFYYALARLGGHQNRRGDHPPGWLILWRGWIRLLPMVEMALLLKTQKCG